MPKTSSYRDSLLEALTDPAEAAAYLNAGLEDSVESFLKAAKNVAQAHQMTRVAKEAGVQRETLYRTLSDQGNPTLSTLTSVLKVFGLQLSVIVPFEPSPGEGRTENETPPASVAGTAVQSVFTETQSLQKCFDAGCPASRL
jgi:probable addiction module antidote protein